MLIRTARRVTLVRWGLLVAALVAELLGLTIRFDTKSLAGAGGWLTGWLEQAAFLPEILLAVAAALFVMGAARIREIMARMLAESSFYLRWWMFFIAHLAAFAILVLTTAYLFEERPPDLDLPVVWSLGWVGLAAATLGLWLAAVAPIGSWLQLARREYRALLAGAAVGIAAWGSGRLTQRLWRPLGNGTFVIVRHLLHLIYPGSEIVSDPGRRILGVRDHDFLVRIAPDCSGYEGIGLVAVFLVTFLWVFRRSLRFPQALLVLPVGMLGIWLANAVRITALIALGTSWSPKVAVGGFHSQAGWLAFNLIGLGLVAGALRIPFFSRVELKSAETGRVNETPAYLVPFLVILATGMIAGALQPAGFDRLYPLKVITGGLAFWWYRGVYRQLDWGWSWAAVAGGGLVSGLWIAISLLSAGPHTSNLPEELAALPPAWRATWISFRVLGYVIVAPLAEELAFRGYLMRRIGSVDFEEAAYDRCSWLAVLGSSALFGLMHGLALWLPGTLAGLIYALIARRRGRLCDAVFAHATTNSLIAAVVWLTGAWWLWG